MVNSWTTNFGKNIDDLFNFEEKSFIFTYLPLMVTIQI